MIKNILSAWVQIEVPLLAADSWPGLQTDQAGPVRNSVLA